MDKLENIMKMYDELIPVIVEAKPNDKEFFRLMNGIVRAEAELYGEIYGRLNPIRADVVAALMEQSLSVLKAQGHYHEEIVNEYRKNMASVYRLSKRGSE